MFNLKKLFASVTAFAVVASTFAAVPANAQYSAELDGAYNYAYGIGITTMDSIDAANMYGSLTRAAMAKMMSVFAEDVLGRTADTTKDCNFADLTDSLGDLKGYSVKACQLGLMGVGVDSFNPYGVVNRAQFGTVMSRALYGDMYNVTSGDYFTKHLEALKDAGVMNNISNPYAPEVRGYVMLMMQRADESNVAEVTPSECQDPMVQLSCALGLDDCPDACTETEEEEEEEEEVVVEMTAGELEVSLSSSQPSDEVPNGVVAVDVATLVFEAADGEDVILDSIEMEATGYGDYNLVDEVAIYDERGVKVSRTRDVDSDGEVEINFINGYEIKEGSKERLTITAKFDPTTTNGDTFGFRVVDVLGPEDVDGLPLSTQKVSIITINNMGVYEAEVDQVETSVKIGEEDSLIGSFELKNENKEEDLYVKSITFEQIGSIDEEYIEDVVIYADGQRVSDSDVLWDRDEVTIAFDDDGYMLSEDTSSFVEFDIRATITGDPTQTVGFQIVEENDIVIVGARHGFRVSEVGTEAFPMVLSDVETIIDAATVEVEGADILATFDKTEADSVVADKDGFLFGTLELKSMETDYILNDYDVTLTVVSAANYATLAAAGITDIELGGDSYDGTPVVNNVNATTTEFTMTFKDVSIDGGRTTNLQLAVDFDNATTDDTFKFDLSLANGSFELEDLENDKKYTTVLSVNDIFSTTTFDTRTVTVEAGSLTTDSTKVVGQEVVIGNNTDFVAGLGKFIATDAEDILVKKVKVGATYTNAVEDANSNVLTLQDFISDATITVDGIDYDGDIVADTITFEDDFNVDAGEVVDYEIMLSMKDKDLLDNLGALNFSINEVIYRAGDADDTTDATVIALVNGNFTIIENGDLTISMDTTEDDESVYTMFTDADKYVVAGTEGVVLGKVKFNADKENIKVKDLYFDLALDAYAGTLEELKDSITNIYLVTENDTYVGTLDYDAGSELTAKFESINYIVDDADLEYALLKADFSAIDDSPAAITSATAGVDVVATVITTDANTEYTTDVVGVESDEDTGILALGATVASNTTTVAANVPTAVTLTSANTSILSAGTFPVAYLEIATDEQDVNIDADSEVYEAILSTLTVDFSLSAGAASTYTIQKVGGTQPAVALTDEVATSVAALGTDAELEDGAKFVIKAVVSNPGTREDGAIVQVRFADVTTDVVLDDGTGAATAMTVPAGTNKDISVNNEG